MQYLSHPIRYIAFLCLLLLGTIGLKAQIISGYTFSQTTSGSYDTLAAPQVLGSGASLDNETYSVTLPFAFNFDNTIYNNIYVGVNGYISFGTTNPGTGYWMLQSSLTGFEVASAFDANLAGKNAYTQLSYKTLGTAPNRTFVVEWKNFGFSGFTVLTTNFQIRLSETVGTITYSYGNISLTGNSNFSAQVGLRGTSSSYYVNRKSSTSDWLNTTQGTSSSSSIAYQSNQNPPSGLKYIYTPPPSCTVPGMPTTLNLTSTINSVGISYSAPSPSPSGYIIVKTNDSVALNGAPQDGTIYSVGDVIGNGTIIYKGSSTSYTNTGLLSNTSYTYTIFPYNSNSCYNSPKYNTTNPLTATKETLGPRAYYWTSTASTADFQVATNWTPARTHTDVQDTLVFNNGVTASLSNVPATLAVNRMLYSGNTNISLGSNNAAAITVKQLLSIAPGSSCTLGGGNTITMGFNAPANAVINGTLTLSGNCTYDARYSNTVVNGAVYVTGANAEFNTTCTNANNCTTDFKFGPGAKYYHQRNGGKIPSASFDPSATVYLTGVTSVSPTMNMLSNQNKMLGNLVVNCPLATTTINSVNTAGVMYNYNNVDIVNAGQNSWIFGSSLSVEGYLNIHKGNVGTNTLTVAKSVIVDSGVLSTSGNLFAGGDISITAAGAITGGFTLNGNTHQNVTVNGSVTVNGFGSKVQLNNLAGATLAGTITIVDGSAIVTSGKWDGTGRFAYVDDIYSILTYNGASTLYTSPVEWPVHTDKPRVINISMSGPSPYNRVYLQENHVDTGYSNLYMNKGILVLGNYDLRCTHAESDALAAARSFVATNGTGRLIMTIGLGNYYFSYPVGDFANGDKYTPMSFSLTSLAATSVVGVRVVNTAHPNMPATPDYISRYWSVTGDLTPLTYKVYCGFSATDKHGAGQYPLQIWDGSSWTAYQTTIAADTIISRDSLITSDLSNKAFTAFRPATLTAHTYTWNGSVSNDFQVPGNWTPSRDTVSFSDILFINSGGTVQVNNIPGQTVTRLKISNNTTANLSGTVLSNPNFTNSFNFISDNDPQTNELEVENGSTLNFANNGKIAIGFLGSGNKAIIAGKLDMNVYGLINFTNCSGYITATGTLAAGGTLVSGVFPAPFVSGDSTLTIDGTYLNNYTTSSGYIPYAKWNTGSTVFINDRTVFTVPAGLNQSFYNLTYNTPTLAGSAYWNSPLPDSIKGTFNIVSTGTGSLALGTTTTTININKLKMNSGKISLLGKFIFTDSVIKSGGTITCATTNTGMYFAGTSGRQYFASNDTAFFINGNYIITNPYGITAAATTPFTGNPNFTVSQGMTIATAAQPAVATALNMMYTGGTSLTYQGPARQSDATVFPAVNGPQYLTVNLDSTTSVLSVPFTRGISGTLSMQKGDMDLGANSFTLGSSASIPGDYNGTGKIRLTTGSMTRWFSLVSDQTNVGNTYANFPIAYGTSDRSVSLFFNNTSAITTGGTMTVKHTNVSSMTTGLTVNDGTFTINNRFNSNWAFTPGNGLAVGGTIGVALMCGDSYTDPTQLRVMWPQSVAGNNYTTNLAGYTVARNNLSLSNLADSIFYIGTSTANTSNIFISITTGDWNNPSTWDRNAVPGSGDYVFIDQLDTVTIQNNAAANTVTIKPYGTLKVTGGISSVNTSITNNGTFRMEGGQLTLGPAGICNRLFTNPAGAFYMINGKLKINGAFTCYGSGFTQTGGDIIVDANGTASVNTTSPVWIYTTNVNATGGNLVIVDPSATGGSTFIGGGFSPGHHLVLGDSVSTTTASAGFILETNNRPLGSVIVNGTTSVTTGRDVKLYGSVKIAGDLSLRNNNARFLMTQYYMYLKGNLTVDSNTTLVADYPIYLSEVDGTANNIPQTISGKGRIINYSSGTPTANFNSLFINNASGISFNIGDFSFGNQLSLGNGRIDLNGYTMTQNGGATLSYFFGAQDINCWVNGKYRAYMNTLQDGVVHRYPVGNAQAAKTVNLTIQDWNTVTAGGYITVSNVAGDNSNIGSSSINPNKTVNLQYVIDTTNSAGLALGTGALNVAVNYTLADQDPGVTPTNYTIGQYNNAGWNYFAPSVVSPLAANGNIPGNQIAGIYQFGETSTVPIFTQQPQNVQVCAGNDAFIQVTAQNANGYQWQVKTGSVWTSIQNSNLYNGVSSNTLQIIQPPLSMSGFIYRCLAYRFQDSVASSEATLTVGGTVTPSVAITVAPGTTVCAGQPATFTATAVNGGSIPQYQWKVNGIFAGSNLNTFTTSSLPNNALVTCELTSNLACANPANVSSNAISMTILPATPLAVSISSSVPTNTICAGNNVTFTAVVTNGGTSPFYQWKKNGNNTGSNSNTYTDNSLANNDVITCTVTGSECTAGSTVTSNNITMMVNPLVTPQLTIATSNNPVCAGSSAIFTATPANGGTAPAYQWQVNGTNAGTNSSTFNASTLNNGDIVSCVLTSNAGCATTTTATSNNITMTVTPTVTPTIIISSNDTSICAGSSVTFTASSTNGGATPAYQWKINGINTGTNSSTFNASTLNNGDIVSCVLTSNATCLNTPTATSNGITMIVSPVLTPTVAIVATSTSICNGDTAHFTATAINGGTTPVYQWKINGANAGSNSNTFSAATLNSGDVISCVLTSNATGCLSATQATSNNISITVHPLVTPAISIASSAGNTLCQGANAVFTATPANGGTAPAYQWKVNNTLVGNNTATYSTNALNNNDVITCMLNSNAGCLTTNNVPSNAITVSVTPTVTPTVTITATPGNTVPAGTTIVFTANVTNGGTNPVFQWKRNGVIVGTNAATYSTNTLNDGDNISVTVTSSATCAAPQVVNSNAITVHLNQVGIPEIEGNAGNVNVYPNPAKDYVTITADFKVYTTAAYAHVELQNVFGQPIVTADNLPITSSGLNYQLPIPSSLASGTYLIKLEYQGYRFVRKIIVEK